MSKPRPHLDNSKETADKYIHWLKTIPYVKKVCLVGSRAIGKEKEHSDWDILVITDRKLKLPNPRMQFNFNCDVSIRTHENNLKNYVEL